MIWATVPKPGPTESMILQMVGTALLWPGDGESWRAVFLWADEHPDHPITRTMLGAVASQTNGERVRECLELGRDWEQRKEPIWLTRAFAEAEGGDTEAGVQMRLEKRRRAAQRRAARKQHEAIG
jgi:hypothetical protein